MEKKSQLLFTFWQKEELSTCLSTCCMVVEADRITAIRAGDESMIGRLYDDYRMAFLLWSQKYYPLEEETLIDIYQDAVIILYQNIVEEKITELQSSLKTYLFGITKHLIFRELKRQQRSPNQVDEIPEIAVAPQYLVQAEQDHQQQMLQQALAKLGSNCQRLIEYFYYYNFGMEVIAQRMRYKNADTVKAQKHRCMKRLQALFNQHK